MRLTLATLVLLACALLPGTRVVDAEEEAARRATSEDVSGGSAASWASLAQRMSDERDAVVSGLLRVVEDPRGDSDRTSEALVMLGRFPTDRGLTYCLDRIATSIPRAIVSDVDPLKLLPARYALSLAGWRAVPVSLEWVARKERSADELKLLALTLAEICGKSEAIALVSSRRAKLTDGALGRGKANWERLEQLLREIPGRG